MKRKKEDGEDVRRVNLSGGALALTTSLFVFNLDSVIIFQLFH